MELKQEHLARDDVRSLRIVRLRWRIAPAVVVVGDQVPIRKLPCMDRCMCNVEEDETHMATSVEKQGIYMTAGTCPVASCISICVCKWAAYGPVGPCIRMHACMRRAICRTCSTDIYFTSGSTQKK